MSDLSKLILKILTFFDVQDFPLTLVEIASYLSEDVSLSELKNTLSNELGHLVSTDGVFYFLANRKDLVIKRHANYRTSLKRFRKAKKTLYWMRYLPFVRSVSISGSQALLNSRENSDIDLFIITAKNRIWIARLFVTTFLQVLGQRRHGKLTKNRFCLNHYIEQDIQLERDQNLYTAILYSNLLPVFGLRDFQSFVQKQLWIEDYIKHPIIEKSNLFFGYESSMVQKLVEFLFELTLAAPVLNGLGRIYQKSRIKSQDHVFVSDQELSFHPESKGQQILAKFREKIHLTTD